jgi:pyrroloquinoline quinone biosynthesis protein E
MNRIFATPTTANLELTEICNVQCSHCYNPWREESTGSISLEEEKLKIVFDRLSDAGVFHVVLTGGEPFSKFKTLLLALKMAHEKKMSASVNSNLMLATDDKIRQLTDLGLDHILTSLPSVDPATTDKIMNKQGSFDRIMRGIETSVRNGVRVSVNMVVTRDTKDHVYEAGKLVAKMGVQTLFVTRAVPPTYSEGTDLSNFILSPQDTKRSLDDAIRVKEDFGIMIGSLVSYPLCFLEDLKKYEDFVGRGCPAQSGHRMSLNANGDIHACVHEEESYGNIFASSVREVFNGEIRRWRDGSMRYEGCDGCPYTSICSSGCRMSALGAYGAHENKDPLYVGHHVFKKIHQPFEDAAFREKLTAGLELEALKGMRFRAEEGFYLVNIRWGNSITVNTELGQFLEKQVNSGGSFCLSDLGSEYADTLIGLYHKGAIEAPGLERTSQIKKQGLSLNVESLPQPVEVG